MRARDDRKGRVYFVRPVGYSGPIKIGYSDRPKSRLSHLLSWSPVPLEIFLEVPGTPELERNIQECFADCHSHREWFHASGRLLGALEKIAGGTPISEAIDLSDRKGDLRRMWMAAALLRRGTLSETVAT